MIEINLLRIAEFKEAVIASQEARAVENAREIIEECLEHDRLWREAQFALANLNKERNAKSKSMGPIMGKMKKAEGEARAALEAEKEAICARVTQIKAEITETEASVAEHRAARDAILGEIGNPIDTECYIAPEAEEGKPREEGKTVVESGAPAPFRFENGQPRISHPFVMQRMDAIDLEAGNATAGSRGYYLKDVMARLNYALINYAMDFIRARDPEVGITQVPFFMTYDLMAKCAQLSDFNETLYKINGDAEDGSQDKFLIATSEQPLCALHYAKRYTPAQLPIKHCGMSTCFRKEAGRHGVDQLGIFRIHQFEKIEQFRVCAPEDSPKHFHEMIETAKAFYDSIGLPYRVINIAAHELNNAAAIKYDLEAWFPGSQTYRELVSCSNCTDYQSRRLNVTMDDPKFKAAETERFRKAALAGAETDAEKAAAAKQTGPTPFVHMLNSTLCATERTLCCIVENFQREDGIEIPEVLRPYFWGRLGAPLPEGCTEDFIPYPAKLTGKYKEQCDKVVARVAAEQE